VPRNNHKTHLWRAMKRLSIAIPSRVEQDAIVRFLEHTDYRIQRYIRAKKKLIALLNEQKQTVIDRAVTRGLDPTVRLKPSGVEWSGDVPEHWWLPASDSAITSVSGRWSMQRGQREPVSSPICGMSMCNGIALMP